MKSEAKLTEPHRFKAGGDQDGYCGFCGRSPGHQLHTHVELPHPFQMGGDLGMTCSDCGLAKELPIHLVTATLPGDPKQRGEPHPFVTGPNGRVSKCAICGRALDAPLHANRGVLIVPEGLNLELVGGQSSAVSGGDNSDLHPKRFVGVARGGIEYRKYRDFIENDPVGQPETHHPGYYNQVPGIECWDVIKHFPTLRGMAIKHLWRAGMKGDVLVDLRKVIEYVTKEIEWEQEKRAQAADDDDSADYVWPDR